MSETGVCDGYTTILCEILNDCNSFTFLTKVNKNDNRKQHRDLTSYEFFNRRTVTVKVSKLGYKNSKALKLGRFTNDCMCPNHDSSGSYLHTDSADIKVLFLGIYENVCMTVSLS